MALYIDWRKKILLMVGIYTLYIYVYVCVCVGGGYGWVDVYADVTLKTDLVECNLWVQEVEIPLFAGYS